MSGFTAMPGDTITLGTVHHADCPYDIVDFLNGRGWTQNHSARWASTNYVHNEMTWEQAVAVEFYRFITLGGR